MNELERLARWHQAMADEPKRNQEKREKHAQTAAILLAASKVDVAGLMELVAKVSNAAYVAGLQDANGEGCDATAQTLFEDELETALRMALAQRGWVGLTDDEIHNLDPLPHQMHDQERIDYAKSIEAKLKEKNHD